MSDTTLSPPVACPSPAATARFDFAEIVALAMTVVIGVGAFAWSFDALTGLSTMAGIRPELAWVGPVFVDGAIIQAIVALVALQRRERTNVEIPRATRWFFWAELLAAELISVAGNGLHAATSDHLVLPAMIAACVAGAAPLAGLAATHGLTALLQIQRPAVMEATAGDADATPGDSGATPGNAEATGDYIDATPVETDATEARDAEILRLSKAGLSTRQIAPHVDLHYATVSKILARLRGTEDEQKALPASPNFRLVAGGTPVSEFTQE